jgi:hypothetical protein
MARRRGRPRRGWRAWRKVRFCSDYLAHQSHRRHWEQDLCSRGTHRRPIRWRCFRSPRHRGIRPGSQPLDPQGTPAYRPQRSWLCGLAWPALHLRRRGRPDAAQFRVPRGRSLRSGYDVFFLTRLSPRYMYGHPLFPGASAGRR